MSTAHFYARELQLTGAHQSRCPASVLINQRTTLHDRQRRVRQELFCTPVTIVDFAAQASIIPAIHNAFPDDDIVGEEDSTALCKDPDLLDREWELATSTHLDDEISESLLHTPRAATGVDIRPCGWHSKCCSSRSSGVR